jgi:outer membrane biogenesis lipoprotein LolB
MLLLSTPTGQGLARLVRTGRGAELTTAEGRYQSASGDELTARLFGVPLPLEALSHWVLGRSQDGTNWAVEVQDHREEGGRRLPSRLLLRTDGAELRLVIDEWSRLP